MSEEGYIVVSEDPFGGSRKLVFITVDAKADAEYAAQKWIEECCCTREIRVEKIDIVQM
jgi:hypothetical protein